MVKNGVLICACIIAFALGGIAGIGVLGLLSANGRDKDE